MIKVQYQYHNILKALGLSTDLTLRQSAFLACAEANEIYRNTGGSILKDNEYDYLIERFELLDAIGLGTELTLLNAIKDVNNQ